MRLPAPAPTPAPAPYFHSCSRVTLNVTQVVQLLVHDHPRISLNFAKLVDYGLSGHSIDFFDLSIIGSPYWITLTINQQTVLLATSFFAS